MGRSTTSCFKIITCASDSVDRDDGASESKGSSNKRGWSFRKRSAGHRVLSNIVISETPSPRNKESSQSTNVNVQGEVNSTIPEKTSGMQCTDEIPQFSSSVNESVIIVIQAAIRRFLAQRTLMMHKNTVKLQAAVRGHLVRMHAVGTLRCVQAIVKMQALVRARRARLAGEGSSVKETTDEKHGKDDHNSKFLGKQNSGTKPHIAYISIEKLLSNRFARQLLESTPRSKPINIKCDPSRSDSAWIWMERWTSVSPTGIEESHKPELSTELQEQEKVKHPQNQVETIVSSEIIGEEEVPSESEENLITSPPDNFDIQAFQSTSSLVSHNLEQPQPENTVMSNSKENTDLLPNQARQSDFIPQMELNSLSCEPELGTEQPKRSMKRSSPEQLETEGRKFVFGSRKASNAAFIAAQSKFAELTCTTNSGKSISLTNQDVRDESYTDNVSPVTDNATITREISLAENSVLPTSKVQVGSSACCTELSIPSTLDSPDRSEVGAVEFVLEAKVLEEGTVNPKSTEILDVEAKVKPTIPGTDLSYPISVQPENDDNGNGADGEPFSPIMRVDSHRVKQKLEENASGMKIELESETGHQVYKSSPEASPRSHITVPESQGTPSSQVSAKAKKIRSDKKGSNQKHKSLSAGKRSPMTPNHDSGISRSLEQLPKDHKTEKRRNSFASARLENIDQEPRDSSNSNSLPSYMQATESARAKAHASSSPRSSPDVQDKDLYIKKRHSLPGANGRQGSPRIQRSVSQAQQSTKGNGTHPHERKWLR